MINAEVGFMRALLVLLVVTGMILSLGLPATADPGGILDSNAEYGQHVREHVQEMGGFSGEMNPGVHHQGKSGWEEHHADGHSH